MLRTKFIAVVVGLFALTWTARAQEQYSKVIIYPASGVQRAHLLGLLQIDHFMEMGGGLVTEISARSLARLQATGAKHKVLVRDVAENLKKENAKFFAAKSRGIDPSV